MKYINDVHEILRQAWQLFEKSPKKTAVFVKVQSNVNNTNLTQGMKTKTVRKLKKACKTRWLSFDQSVQSAKQCLYALLFTLKELEKDSAVAAGLYKKMRCAKFVGTVYLLSEILPVLTMLSKTFQHGRFCYGQISSSIDYAKHQLKELLTDKNKTSFVTETTETLETGNLNSAGLVMSENTSNVLTNLKERYINSLIQNIDQRFSTCQDIYEAFKIFDPQLVPGKESDEFSSYGKSEIELLGGHFFANDISQLLAEWNRFKFDLVKMSGVGRLRVVSLKLFFLQIVQAFNISNASE